MQPATSRRNARRAVATLGVGLLAASTILSAPDIAQAATEHGIAEIQGTSASSPLTGQTVTTEPSVITAVYPSEDGFAGFVIQAPGSGGTWDREQASQAVFVYAGSKMGSAPYDVRLGEAVTVTGKVSEHQGLTEINATEVGTVDEALAAPKPITGVSWQDTAADRENLESMLYAPEQKFTVADTYPLYKYGELALGADGVPVQPTDVGAPGSSAYDKQLAADQANAVGLDDGTNKTFTVSAENAAGTLPYLTAKQDIRRGDGVTINKPVIVDYRNGSWKFNPPEPTAAGDEVATVERGSKPSVPQVGGDLSVASFNVLNYFTTTGKGRDGCTGSNPDTTGSDNVTFDCDVRGAWDSADLARQQAKIVAAINKLDPSVAGLMEIENSAQLGEKSDEAVATLVKALNDAAGEDKWANVASSKQLPDEADVITNALIYQPDRAELVTDAYADGADASKDGPFANARTPIAAGFEPTGGGEPLLVSVNHFKSKGSAPDDGPNADQGDGQGAWNAARVQQAKALSTWIGTVSKDAKIKATALIGDFNSYSQEDPIRTLADAGFSNTAPADQYSYTYDGLAGSLDHVLLNKAAAKRKSGAGVWGINSPEPLAAEYSTYKTTKIDYYRADPYRSSDHDPVLVGFNAGKKSAANLTLLNINDFHGRIAEEEPDTTAFLGTAVQQQDEAGADSSLFLSAGDNIGASLFASSIQKDKPTIDALNAAGLAASAVGNHEFDKGVDDLTGRVADRADWSYLGANVYKLGSTDPILPEYELFERSGLDIAVIGAVTQETASLVSPDGIKSISYGDPVAAVNRVAGQLTDGQDDNGEADVIIAEYHEGAVEGEPSGTLDDEVSKGGAFAKIIKKTSPAVDVIFTGHTHQEYVWDAPVGSSGKTRPVVQTGSYGSFLGKVVLTLDPKTGAVESYTAKNIGPTTTPVEDLVDRYPAVAKIKTIVDDALASADELGSVAIGKATAPITRATVDTDEGEQEDRAGESTISNTVATMFADQLSDPLRGGAQIGIQNPGGNRADLDDGEISYAEAAAVLPFANTLVTLDLTGAQFKTVLEQQWQTEEDGSPCTECSRPYLQLGLSDNVSYTYDETRDAGDRITSITIDGRRYDPQTTYRIGTASFLASGGDNFWAFADAANKKDSGLIDLDSWTDWIKADSPISPSFARRAGVVDPLPSTLTAGDAMTLKVGSADRTTGGPNNTTDLSSDGAPANTKLTAVLETADDDQAAAVAPEAAQVKGASASKIGTAAVIDGVATITLDVPADAAPGPATLTLTAGPSDTVITLPVRVAASDDDPTTAPPSTAPTAPGSHPGGDDSGPGSPLGDELADTGSPVGPGLITLALALLIAGTAFVISGRRRR